MKAKTEKIKLITMFVLLLIAIISVTNVTYSFFSSTASSGGEMAFGTMNFKLYYNNTNNTLANNKLTVVPDGPISRGKSFSVYLEQDESTLVSVQEIGFINSGTVNCYVRFWIDAFIEGDESGTNYGKYFYIEAYSNDFVRKRVDADSSPACYYAVSQFGENEGNYFYINKDGYDKQYFKMQDIPASDLDSAYKTVTDALPLDILGEELKITISFEAVQAANEAWKSVFNDELGYYDDWE